MARRHHALQRLSTIIANTDSALLFTDTPERAELFVQVERIKAARPLINGVTPPASMEPAHEDLREATRYFDEAMDIFVEGVTNVDAGKIEASTVLMGKGTEMLESASVKLDEAP